MPIDSDRLMWSGCHVRRDQDRRGATRQTARRDSPYPLPAMTPYIAYCEQRAPVFIEEQFRAMVRAEQVAEAHRLQLQLVAGAAPAAAPAPQPHAAFVVALGALPAVAPVVGGPAAPAPAPAPAPAAVEVQRVNAAEPPPPAPRAVAPPLVPPPAPPRAPTIAPPEPWRLRRPPRTPPAPPTPHEARYRSRSMSCESMAPLPPPPPPLPRMTIDVYTKVSTSPTVQREDAQLARFVSAVRGTLHAHVEQLWDTAALATAAHYTMISAEDTKRWAFQVGENKRAKSDEAYAMWRQLALLRAKRATISLGRDLVSSIKIVSRCEELKAAAVAHAGTVKQHSLLPQRGVREAEEARRFARSLFEHACETHRVMATRALRPLSRRPGTPLLWREQALAQLRGAARVSYDITDARCVSFTVVTFCVRIRAKTILTLPLSHQMFYSHQQRVGRHQPR